MDRAELREPVPGEGEAAGPEGAPPQHRQAAPVRRPRTRVLVPTRREGKVRYHFLIT